MGSRLFNWFVTEKGRRAMGNLAGIVAFGCLGAHVIPNSVGLEKYKEFVQAYSSGVARPVAAEVLERAQMVLKECEFPDLKANFYNFFTVVGLDTFHAGSTSFSQGSLIGIPHNFRYKKEEDVDRNSLLVNQQPFDFDSPTGIALLRSMVLSERAQKFAIAKEIHAADTLYVYMYGCVAAMAALLVYALSNVINTKTGFLHKVPRTARVTIYTINTLIGVTLYCFLKDGLNHYYDKEADVAACNMGMDYALGGVEFYRKLLERNRALREAMGAEGRSLYTMFGNEEVVIRTKRLPITAHLDIVKDMLKALEKAPNTSSTDKDKVVR